MGNCDCDANGFGYVKIEDDMVVTYTDDPSNPTVHKFCNEEIVEAVRIKKILDEIDKHFEEHEDSMAQCPECHIAPYLHKVLERNRK